MFEPLDYYFADRWKDFGCRENGATRIPDPSEVILPIVSSVQSDAQQRFLEATESV